MVVNHFEKGVDHKEVRRFIESGKDVQCSRYCALRLEGRGTMTTIGGGIQFFELLGGGNIVDRVSREGLRSRMFGGGGV